MRTLYTHKFKLFICPHAFRMCASCRRSKQVAIIYQPYVSQHCMNELLTIRCCRVHCKYRWKIAVVCHIEDIMKAYLYVEKVSFRYEIENSIYAIPFIVFIVNFKYSQSAIKVLQTCCNKKFKCFNQFLKITVNFRP